MEKVNPPFDPAEVQEQINATPSEMRAMYSDGFHSFKELYAYRVGLTAVLFNRLYETPELDFNVHKSWKHHDGQLCFGGGWFIVTVNLDGNGPKKGDQLSFHYEDRYWDMFKCDERETGDEWDGHTPAQALERLMAFSGFTGF